MCADDLAALKLELHGDDVAASVGDELGKEEKEEKEETDDVNEDLRSDSEDSD